MSHGELLPGTNVRNWASEIDENTIQQAAKTGRLPILGGPVALMPDAHVGMGATVGSVIATVGAIIPSAVGVDIGCGMAAVRMNVTGSQLPDDLSPLLDRFERVVPAGVGQGHLGMGRGGEFTLAMPPRFTDKQRKTAVTQMGTLGSGNHFLEVSLDEEDNVWIVVHSGSRGIGNQLAQEHIKGAKRDFADVVQGYRLEDPDLAWLVQGTPAFNAYMKDLNWAQGYALNNRASLLSAALREFIKFIGHGSPTDEINCHHNYTSVWNGMYLTRKGAIAANWGDRGIIPGSMGTDTFLVSGLGNNLSYNSCSHGAGRRMSRTRAKKELTIESLETMMADKTWLSGSARALLDEHPDSYKSIEAVMADQSDLVKIEHRLSAVLNYKGCK